MNTETQCNISPGEIHLQPGAEPEAKVCAAPKCRHRKRREPQPGSGAKGYGSVFQNTFIDRKTGQRVKGKWAIAYHIKGRLSREFGFISEDAAREALKLKLAQIVTGTAPSPDARKVRLGQLTDLVVADYGRNDRKSNRRVREAIAHLLQHFGADYLASDLSENRVDEYIDDRRAQRSRYGRNFANGTINRELAMLRRAFNLGVEKKLIREKPVIKLLKEPKGRKGFFEKPEFDRVLAEVPDYIKPILNVAYTTGWRLASEILTRKPRHLDLDAGMLRLDPGEAKSGEGRAFYLTPQLKAVLAEHVAKTHEWEKRHGRIVEWLFHRDGVRIRDIRTAWEAACRRAGVGKKLIHDFRRTAVRNLERAGIARSTAMAMVGHETEAIYRRYAIVSETDLSDAAVKLAALQAGDAAKAANVVPLKAATEN